MTRYRLYSPAQLAELRRILALRELGIGLDTIAGLVASRADLAPVLHARQLELEAQRREIDRQLAVLGVRLHDVSGDDVVVRDIASQYVAFLGIDTTGGDVGRAFYELEAAVRDAGARVALPPGRLDAADGTPSQVFVPVRRGGTGPLRTGTLDPCRAATTLHRGSYPALAARRAALERWIVAAGLRPVAPARVIYLQFGAEPDLGLATSYLVSRSEDLVTEVQIPVA